MFKLFCVTNRRLCNEDFFRRVEAIAAARPDGIIIREKDLSEEAYEKLAAKTMAICARHDVPCVLHSFTAVAIKLKSGAIHLPLPLLRKMTKEEKGHFHTIGVSCHSLEEIAEAEALGATYATAGHIFATDCKKGVPPRGLPFLKEAGAASSLPVYAIGGIRQENISEIYASGAAGACVMSGLMRCNDPGAYMKKLRETGGPGHEL